MIDDIKKFLVAVSVNLASHFLTSPLVKDIDEKVLQEACKEGIDRFVRSFYPDHIDSDYIRALLENKEVTAILLEMTLDSSRTSETGRLRNTIDKTGVDVETIEGFDIKKASLSFSEGFWSKADHSIALLQPRLEKEELDHLKGNPVDPESLKEEYFAYIRGKFDGVSFSGLSEKLLSYPLTDIYTTLSLSKDTSREKMNPYKQIEKPESDGGTIKDFSALPESNYSVITGGPGGR